MPMWTCVLMAESLTTCMCGLELGSVETCVDLSVGNL
jgi:hypothetical protein